jgi:type I restriction enzyme S subunit
MSNPAAGWRESTLGALVQECNDRVGSSVRLTVLSSTKHYGLIPSDEYFKGRIIYSTNLSNYKRVEKNWFAYATNHLPEGSIGLQESFDVACVSPIYTVFRCQEVVYPQFLYRLLKSPELVYQYSLHEQASVDRRGAVRFRDFATIRVRIPESLSEQKLIAEILDAADEDINATEELRTKFKNITSSLLNDLLSRVDAPARPLSEFLTARPRNGFSPNESESWTGVLALGLGCLTTEGFVPRQLKNVPARDARYATAWLSDGDLLISRSNTYELVGLVGRYRDVGVPCVYPDLMMKLTPNGLVRPEFLELVLRNTDARSQIKRISQGTSGSMVKITGASLVEVRVRIPDFAEQDRVLATFAAQTTQLGALEREVAKLRMVKQGLMEDLLTGRVPVSELS